MRWRSYRVSIYTNADENMAHHSHDPTANPPLPTHPYLVVADSLLNSEHNDMIAHLHFYTSYYKNNMAAVGLSWGWT